MITENGDTEFRGNIGQLEEKTPFLIKVSQSYLVNPVNIRSIDTRRQIINFNNNVEINYSRSFRKVVKQQLIGKFDNIQEIR